MNIAICDDVNAQLDILEKSIANCPVWNDDKPTVIRFTDGRELLRSAKAGASFSYIFIDIEMPYVTGLDLYEDLATKNTAVVFVSAHTKYFPESRMLLAPGFLHKGYDQDTFDRTVKSIIEQRSDEQLFEYSFSGKTHAIPCMDILMFSVEKRTLCVHTLVNGTVEKVYLYIGSLSKIEQQLSAFGFFRCGKNHLVNLRYCSGRIDSRIDFKSECVSDDVQISRRRQNDFDSRIVQLKWR